jgi:hypothetical protein
MKMKAWPMAMKKNNPMKNKKKEKAGKKPILNSKLAFSFPWASKNLPRTSKFKNWSKLMKASQYCSAKPTMMWMTLKYVSS